MSITNKVNGFKALLQFDNRWQLILSRLLFRHEKINVYRYKGLEVLVDYYAGEAHIIMEVLGGQMYRGYIRQMDLNGPLNVLDIGANNGCFPLAVTAEGKKIKKLASVELNPRTYSRLKFNVDRNLEDSETDIINGAVCGESREIEIALGVGAADDNIYKSKSDGKTWRLPGYTFNDIYHRAFEGEEIDVCKIDIEGAEFEIFANEGHDLIKKCRYVLMEIHHTAENNREVVRNKMKELGFAELEPEGKDNHEHYVHFFKRT